MITDLKELLKKFFTSRILVIAIFIFLMFGIIAGRVFILQIVEGEAYQENFTLLIDKTLPINAARGNFYDCNGNLLAYNELAYSITISDTGSYDTTSQKNKAINSELAEILKVLERNGETLNNTFGVSYDEDDGSFYYNVSGTSLRRFLADVFGYSSPDDLTYNKDFGFDEAEATADQIMEYLCDESCFSIDSSYGKKTGYEIAVIRYFMNQNRYSRYKSTSLADNVSDQTVAYVKEHSDRLTGIMVEENYIRKYNDAKYFAGILGYTGKISTEEYQTLSAEDSSYTINDTVGKAGLEQYYESSLRGTNGEKNVYINNVGKITEVISQTDSVPGSDVYLSIDADLQKTTYDLLEQEIAGVLYTNLKNGNISDGELFNALIKNNLIDISHFTDEDASETEEAVYRTYSSSEEQVLAKISIQLDSSPVKLSDLSDELLDCYTCIMDLLKEDGLLLTSRIDTEDDTYQDWKNSRLSPKEYLQYCISKEWIDISLLDVGQKYADTAEIYQALVEYLMDRLPQDKDFSKIIYEYLIKTGSISGRQLVLILFDQGFFSSKKQRKQIENNEISAYSFLLDKIDRLELTPAQLALDPCTGSCVITDTETGEIKALVSYPGYDNNLLANGVDEDYYNSLREDLSNPLWNYATQERTAPGSTFKMVSSTAGLSEGVINTDSEIKCTGVYDKISNHPKCWIYPGGHSSINVSEALRDSCNVFFYTVGYRLASKKTGNYNDSNGISLIQKYADLFGLNQKTGLEISEYQSEIATEFPVMAAIGQSNHNITTVALSRYVTAIASGKLYNYQLMSKIVDASGQETASYEAEGEDISDLLTEQQWTAVHKGMRMVVTSLENFDGLKTKVAGKTGTAQQVETRPNHALFVGYAPYNDPEISIAVRIAYGYSSHNAAQAARNIISCYYNETSKKKLLSGGASGVGSSNSNSFTD